MTDKDRPKLRKSQYGEYLLFETPEGYRFDLTEFQLGGHFLVIKLAREKV